MRTNEEKLKFLQTAVAQLQLAAGLINECEQPALANRVSALKQECLLKIKELERQQLETTS